MSNVVVREALASDDSTVGVKELEDSALGHAGFGDQLRGRGASVVASDEGTDLRRREVLLVVTLWLRTLWSRGALGQESIQRGESVS